MKCREYGPRRRVLYQLGYQCCPNLNFCFLFRLIEHDAGRGVPPDQLRISELRRAGSHLRKAVRWTGSGHLVSILENFFFLRR